MALSFFDVDSVMDTRYGSQEVTMDWNADSKVDGHAFDPTAVFEAGLTLHHISNTAYPIGHNTTMRPYGVGRQEVQRVARDAWSGVNRLGLYVHVPFCERRCAYCEYAVMEPSQNQDVVDGYLVLLMREFELYRQALGTSATQLVGFDIGGGTPAWLSAGQVGQIVSAARGHFQLPADVVISIETTPKIAASEPDKIKELYKMGIGRISMGVQTISPRLLEQVGRDSTTLAYNRAAAEHIRAAGFGRFNIDVMYGFADQALASWEATLRHVIGLSPEYITLYRMRYKGTRIADQARRVTLDEINAQYSLASEILAAAGYATTPGKNTFSRLAGDVGTSDYLTERVIHGTPYLGLGLGAQSLSQVTLSYNAGAASKTLLPYQRQIEAGLLPLQDLYHLSRPAAMAKMIAVSFYFGEINDRSFQAKFGLGMREAYPAEVDFVLGRGLMGYVGDSLRLTGAGVKQMNGVIALFYNGEVKQLLLDRAAAARA